MSYIDCFKHELVGYFNGPPIYHPLEHHSGDGWECADFSCSPKNLILGGAGEHPAIVLHNLSSLVTTYILFAIENYQKYFPQLDLEIPDKIQSKLEDIFYNKEKLEFCNWSMQHYYQFYINAQSSLHSSPLQEDGNAEEWIEHSIGEFIYYSLPELLSKEDQEFFKFFKILDLGFWMKNVTCPPPNYIKTRKESIEENNWPEIGHFRWGYSID